jgi:hypothetical protein
MLVPQIFAKAFDAACNPVWKGSTAPYKSGLCKSWMKAESEVVGVTAD